MEDRFRVAVVGGGITGLSAAWYLQAEPRIDLVLFEAASKVGGVIDTVYAPPNLIELGADNFATLAPDALEFSKELGLESELMRPRTEDRQAKVLFRGEIHPVPVGFSLGVPSRPLEILRSPLLSVRGKLRMLLELLVAPRTDLEDESLESFMVRRLGREAFERLVEPIVAGIYAADATKLSMAAALPQIWELERNYGGLIRSVLARRKLTSESDRLNRQASGARYDQFLAPRLGMRWWIDQIKRKLDRTIFQFDQKVKSIRQSEGRWSIELSDGQYQNFDAIVVAVPAFETARILSSFPSLSDELQQIEYASTCVAVASLNNDEIPKEAQCFGIVLPRVEREPVLAISFASKKYEGRSAQDKTLARVFLGGALHPEVMGQPDSEITQLTASYLERWLRLRKQPEVLVVKRWENAMPQYSVGHLQRVVRIEKDLESLPGLSLAGSAYRGVGIPQCVRSGRESAQKILERIKPKT